MGGGEKDATSGENSLSRGDPSGPWNWGSDWPCCPLVATACRYRSSPGLHVLGGHLVHIPECLLHPWRRWSWERSLSVTTLPHKAPDVSPRGSDLSPSTLGRGCSNAWPTLSAQQQGPRVDKAESPPGHSPQSGAAVGIERVIAPDRGGGRKSS